MTVGTLLSTYRKCRESDRSTKFQNEFMGSLVKNAHKYCKSRFIPNDVFHSANRDLKLNFSEKQLNIYSEIEERFNPKSSGEDLYHKYSEIFRQKGIILNSFDKRHLETFKGIFKESENFKKWLSQIYPINK